MIERPPPAFVCVMIGPPGAGKTSALAAANTTLIADIPGRLAVHDTTAAAERKEWQALLSDLAKAKSPPRGVVVAIGVDALKQPGRQALGGQLAAIRARIDELCDALDASLPVWLLFTKIDLLPGFTAFMGGLDDAHRCGIWGTVDTTPSGFDALAARLAEDVATRLHEEPDPAARMAIFAFPQQFALLREPVAEVMRQVFAPARKNAAAASPRGFYFGSATEGGFFLHDLLAGLIPQEARGATSSAGSASMWRSGAMAAAALAAIAVLGAGGMSFVANRALTASVTDSTAEQRTAAALLAETAVTDAGLDDVGEVLETLRNLPTGYATRGEPAPFAEGFGLSQRGKLAAAAEAAYGRALERLLRPRLILRLEEAVQAGMGNPVELYEPLKAYLMLGGEAPSTDGEMIAAWFEYDWQDSALSDPGGHEKLAAHLRAMLDLSRGQETAFELDRPLVEAAQRSLARMDLSEFAWALIQSGSYGAQLVDFSVTDRGGAQTGLVFGAGGGGDADALSVPGAYTWAGFNAFLLPQLSTIAQRLVDDQWIMGAGGEQVGVEQQLRRLGPELLDRYGKEFLAIWGELFDLLHLKPLTADRPDYAALRAVASPSSPLRALVEAIAAETALTRAPREGEGEGLDITALDEAAMIQGLARIGIEVGSMKSQNRAGSAFATSAAQPPGANVEAQFRQFQMLVDGIPGRRPIDALVQNFSDVLQSLLLAANTPSQAERARANLQLQVHNLRTNASRLPRQLAAMIHKAADEFESDGAQASVSQLARLMETVVTGPCQAIVSDAYPFSRGSHRDVSMADFTRLFAPGGELDRFFAQNLAPLADITGQRWRWKQDDRLGQELSDDALQAFQQAARIRAAFFPPGSGAMPTMEITFTPFSLHGDADMALLDVDGQIVQSYRTGNVPATVTWPDARAIGGVTLSLTPEIQGRATSIRFEGPWALLRLFDTATSSREGDELRLQFVVGGRDVTYTVGTGATGDPSTLSSLADFRCPEGL